MPDRRHFITIQQGSVIIWVASNRSKAFNKLGELLIKAGIDRNKCKVRVSDLERVGTHRVLAYGPLRDLLNGANPLAHEGVDIVSGQQVLYRLQRHQVNGGE